MRNDFRGKAVVITGGTKGIGLATGVAFARQGAHCYLTHRWGSAKEEDVLARFAGMTTPTIVEADVSQDEDTVKLLELVKQQHDRVAVFVSNVAAVQPANGIESYRRRSLHKSLEYSAWPLVAYLQHMKKIFGVLPRYAVGISSDGPDKYFAHYEYVAASKAVMETLCRYLTYELRKDDIRINIIRSRNVLTDAVTEIFGPEYVEFMGKFAGERYFMKPEDVANVVLALASGMMDSMKGQVLEVDKGMAFADTLSRLLEVRKEIGI